MRLPEQNAPVIRPAFFPILTTTSASGELVELSFSNTDPNDPAWFSGSSDVAQAGCHILSDAGRCFAGRSRF